jgi:hypothetical protein
MSSSITLALRFSAAAPFYPPFGSGREDSHAARSSQQVVFDTYSGAADVGIGQKLKKSS